MIVGNKADYLLTNTLLSENESLVKSPELENQEAASPQHGVSKIYEDIENVYLRRITVTSHL